MSNQNLLDIAQKGLNPIEVNSKSVIIVGAGMAGLVAACELKRAGYQVTVLEAQNRAGGRIETIRDPFPDGMYGEVGAMRVPKSHTLTMHYIEQFNLKTMPFHGTTDDNFYHIGGKRYMLSDVAQNPSILGMNLTDPDGVSVFKLWGDFLTDAVQRVKQDSNLYWTEMSRDYGNFSFYDFLKHLFRSDEAVRDFSLLSTFDSLMYMSFLETHQFGLEWDGVELCQIAGGMDHLPQAFLLELTDNVQFGAEVIALDYSDDSATIHYRNANGEQQISADFAIITMPFSSLRFVDVLTPFSYGKQTAIRRLNYLELVKVLLQFENRFWEREDDINGGHTVTDLPIMQVYYPEREHRSERGVLIGSYTYGTEARHWASLSEADRVTQTLKYVTKIHPQAQDAFEQGLSKVWGQDSFAAGFGKYYPDEHRTLFPHARTSEGAVHFAGEHTSYRHGWIEGAVESGLRAVGEIHERVTGT